MICLNTILLSFAPIALAASIYSSFFMVITEERTILENGGILDMTIAIIIFCILGPIAATMAIARSVLGIARNISIIRIMKLSRRLLP